MIPLNKILLQLALLCLPFGLFSQVKAMIKLDNSQTTTVVKADQSTDEVILSQLDIDDFGMHEVIRIVYEDKPTEINTLLKPTNVISSTRQEETIEVAFTNNDNSIELTSSFVEPQLTEPTLIQQNMVSSRHAAKVEAPEVTIQKKKLNPYHSGDYPVYTNKKRVHNPRFKKKRKIRKQKRKGCPRF